MQAAWTLARSLAALLFALAWIAGVSWSVGRATDYSWLLWLEHWTGDYRTALFSHRPQRQHDVVTLVAINDETMFPYAYRSPIDRRLLANLVTALDAAGARAVGLDLLFLKPTEKDKDIELVEAIRKARSRIIVAAGDPRAGLNPAQLKYQSEFLRTSGAIGGYANLLTGGDRIVRYVAQPSDDPQLQKSFAVALAQPDARPPGNGPRRIAWMLSPRDGNERFFSIPAHLIVTPSGKPTPVATALLARFKDKVVIIGGDFPDIDRHQVPMLPWRGEDDEVAGMLIHAQVAAQLVDGRNIEHVNERVLFSIFAVLAGLAYWFGLRHGFVAVGMYATAASALVLAADMALFHLADRIIPFGACLMALVGGLIGGIFWRGIQLAMLPRA